MCGVPPDFVQPDTSLVWGNAELMFSDGFLHPALAASTAAKPTASAAFHNEFIISRSFVADSAESGWFWSGSHRYW